MIVKFFERLYFEPKGLDWFLVASLVPFSLIYGSLMWIRRISTKKVEPEVPVVSVGNLLVGGSGKTPFLISLIKSLKLEQKSAVVSRGYGRESRGVVEVCIDRKILVDVKSSGDEAMLIAKSLQDLNVDVVVGENRQEAISQAIQRGAKVIFLDDGFNRVKIKKFEILLYPEHIKNPFPFPAGGFREFGFSSKYANLKLFEERDFFRRVEIENSSSKMILATAISNPKRLKRWLDESKIVAKLYLNDHQYFDKKSLRREFEASNASRVLVTEKDLVKLEDCSLPLAIMRLKIELKPYILERVKEYIKENNAEKDRDCKDAS